MRDFADLVSGLDQLRQIDVDRNAYGARSHRYNLRPPLSEAEVEEFEYQHQVVLPHDYRSFLMRIGSSGAGPGCDGLWPLEKYPIAPGVLAKPFPFENLWCPRCSQETLDGVRHRTGATDLRQGALSIGSYGCSLVIHLVITGSRRGEIWVDDFGSDNGIWPDGEGCACFYECAEDFEQAKSGFRRFTFVDWYANWIRSAKQEALDWIAAKSNIGAVPPNSH